MCFFKVMERSWFCICILTLIGASVGWVHYANVYHAELDVYLPHYLSDKNTFAIIFSPICELDFTNTNFRGREVGSLFNYIDANILAYVIGLGFAVLISPVFYILVFLIIRYTKLSLAELGVSNLTSKALVLLLLSMPPVVLGGTFYRTNKIVAACFILLCLLAAAKLLRNAEFRIYNKKNMLMLFMSTLIASLADEQGLAFEMIIVVYLSGLAILSKRKGCVPALFLMLTALSIVAAYRGLIGPAIFSHLNGAYPISIGSGFIEIGGTSNIIASLGLLVRYTIYVFGNVSPYGHWGIGFLCILFVIVFGKSVGRLELSEILPILLPVLMLIYVMSLMTSKHPAILWKDIVSYYSLPFCFFIYGIFILACQRSLHNGVLTDGKIRVILLLLIVLNLLSLPSYSQIILNGHLSTFRVANGFINAVNADETAMSTQLSLIKLNQLSPGAATLDIAKDGSAAIRRKLDILEP